MLRSACSLLLGLMMAGLSNSQTIANCKTVDPTDVKKCKECNPGFWINAGFTCSQDCVKPCKTCKDDNPQICLSCVEATPPYIVDQSTCVQCSSNCKACNSTTNCTSCERGFFTFSLNVTENAITKEVANCSTCVGLKLLPNCLECATNETCTKCETGYFLENVNCSRCNIDNCLECTSLKSCTKCGLGYIVENGACKACATKDCEVCNKLNTCSRCKSPLHLEVTYPSTEPNPVFYCYKYLSSQGKAVLIMGLVLGGIVLIFGLLWKYCLDSFDDTEKETKTEAMMDVEVQPVADPAQGDE